MPTADRWLNPGERSLSAGVDRAGVKPRSPMTTALNIAFVLVWMAGWFDVDDVIFARFAKVNGAIRAGEVWRLFTASFLHAGPWHLWFNAMALGAIGPIVERLYGKVQYVLAFLVGGATGMLASFVLVPRPSVGASAGIFALLGLLLTHALRSGKANLRSPAIRRVAFVVGLNLVLGLLVPFIDNAAHVGGFLGGVALAVLLRAREIAAPAVAAAANASSATAAARGAAFAPRAVVPPGRTYLRWAGQRWK